jgi:hypothetical protein
MFSAKTFSRHRQTSTRVASAASRPLTLERLEERDVPAGIVSVFAQLDPSMITPTRIHLAIVGDGLDNQMDIIRNSGEVKVVAQGTTVLNYIGSVTATVTPLEITFGSATNGIRDLSVSLGGGSDLVRIVNNDTNNFGEVEVDLGSGNDSFLLAGVSPIDNGILNLSLNSGSGNDSIFIYNSFFPGGNTSLQLGEGHDIIAGSGIFSWGTLSVDMGNGNDQGIFSGTNSFGYYDIFDDSWSGGLTVVGGAGNDVLTFTGQTEVLNKLNINLGDGNDRLLVAAAANTSDPATLSVDGPDGQINARIRLQAGNDLVRFGIGSGSGPSVNFADQTRLELGSGDDRLFIRNAIFNLLIALLGDGNDQVLNNWGSSGVTVGAGSKLHGGAGVDVLPSGWTTPTNLTILAIP